MAHHKQPNSGRTYVCLVVWSGDKPRGGDFLFFIRYYYCYLLFLISISFSIWQLEAQQKMKNSECSSFFFFFLSLFFPQSQVFLFMNAQLANVSAHNLENKCIFSSQLLLSWDQMVSVASVQFPSIATLSTYYAALNVDWTCPALTGWLEKPTHDVSRLHYPHFIHQARYCFNLRSVNSPPLTSVYLNFTTH